MSIIEKAQKLISKKINALSLLDTGWHNRPYDFFLIFGQKDESKSPWIKSSWDVNFEPYFDRLIKQTDSLKETGIRVIKYKPEKRVTKKDNKEFIYHSEVKSGRLKWDLKSHEKWTVLNSTDNYFLNFELSTPIWTVCEKRDSPPDIYITISNERDIENKRETQFGYFIVIAIAKNLKIDSKPILKELSEKINAKATVLKTRKWGKPETVGNWTFVNWIQDTFSGGIYKGQNLHSLDFSELEFEPAWEIIYQEK
ncbi:hypothetical protein GCM10023188_46300 [Pontibacter saemangeumensis]|uniref:Uncharacterized protein n=1 Tax=Pontibacter saemangeumensis TaxID=1084525 RepID=A0ABP8M5C2_9BACT